MKPAEQLAIRIRGGATVITQADLRSMSTYVLLEQGDWFEPEMEFLRIFAQPGMRAIDAGANHGVYSLAFAHQLRGDGHVWALEPTTSPFRLLLDGVRASGVDAAVTPIQCGLSDRARDARMSVAATSELNSLDLNHGAFEPVRLDTIDGLMRGPLRNERIDFVKLDVEGEETGAVRGGADFFPDNRPSCSSRSSMDPAGITAWWRPFARWATPSIGSFRA